MAKKDGKRRPKEKFPPELFVRRDEDFQGGELLIALDSMTGHAVVDDAVPVAVYKLVSVGYVRAHSEYVTNEPKTATGNSTV